MKVKLLAIFAASIFVLIGSANALEVSYVEPTDYREDSFCSNHYMLMGEIQTNDAEKFITIFNNLRTKFKNKKCPLGAPRVTIDSVGGDIVEAIKLGRFMKQNALTVEVSTARYVLKNKKYQVTSGLENGQCLSACVFVLAGGVIREVTTSVSQVGIHRPYFSQIEGDASPSAIKASREQLNRLIKDYFEEVDINPSLLEDMLSIPPDKMRILTDAELERYRLSVNNANYEESETAKNAKNFNLTSGEFRIRSQRADMQCAKRQKNVEQYLNCWQSTVLGISLQEFQARVDKGRRLCTQSGEELKRQCGYEVLILGK